MKTLRITAFSIVILMLLSILTSFGGEIVQDENLTAELSDEPIVMEVSSPGHPVFSQYITSDNCGYCYQYGSPAHHSLKTQHPDDFVYISYQSQIFQDTDTARAGNTAGYNWPWTSSGAPDSYWGDRLDKRASGCGSNTCYDSMFSSGGGMSAATTSQYSLSAAVSDGGSTLDVQVDVQYLGSGTAPTMYIYAAMTEETCNSYVYNDGSKGHNCWKSWLMSGGSFRTQSGGTGNGFQSVTLNNNAATYTWSIPKNHVSGGFNNALAVAALMTGAPSTGASNEHVLTATDSSMVPPIDIGVKTFTASNPSAPNGGYINGDIIDVSATIANNGADAYTDGGDVRFYYKVGNSKTYVGPTRSLSNFARSGDTQFFSGQIDTTPIVSSAYQTTFGVEVSNLITDKFSSNNDGVEVVPHDLTPVVRKAQVIGSNQIERGDNFLIEAKTSFNDGVDINTSFFTFDLEVSPAGIEQWISGDMIVGGDEIFQEGTSNEHREYLVKPGMDMGAGFYDIRIRSIDSRSQASDWMITDDGFELKNALPTINSDPVSTVKVQTSTKVSITNNVNDAETELSMLDITSMSPNFVAWHPATEEVEVYFENIRFVNGQPTASGIEIAVSDGVDTGYGTLLFNVIENGQPRWAGVEKQYVDEGAASSLFLLPYLSDTDGNGEISPSEDLVLAIIENTNPELLNIELNDFALNFETSNSDVNGETTITIRASDGQQVSDQIITIAVNPINDAPRLDLSEFEDLRLRVGTQKVIHFNEILTDVDSDVSQVIVTASNSVPGAARVDFLDNTLTLNWADEGAQTVTLKVEDRYDSQTYVLVVDVYDGMPMTAGESVDSEIRVDVSNVYIDETPRVSMFLNKDDVTITSLTTTWQLCNSLTGICSLNVVLEHDITAKNEGWTFDPMDGELGESGMQEKDYITLAKAVAIADNGDKFEFKDTSLKWSADESAPGLESMTEDEVKELVSEIQNLISSKKSDLAGMESGTSEFDEVTLELETLESELEEACEYTTCEEQNAGSSDATSSELDTTVILIVIGVVIISLLAGIMFMRGGNKDSEEVVANWANELPANDTVANSMFGGAQEIFQQPVATPAPVVQQVPVGALPLPPGGLPHGWTMEQWAYYGHQYQQ